MTDYDACISVEARVGRILAAQFGLKVVGIWNKLIECVGWYDCRAVHTTKIWFVL